MPEATDGPVNLLYLGDERLASYRSTVTAAIVRRRQVIDQELVTAPGATVAPDVLPQLPTGSDLVILGIGTDDVEAGTEPAAFGRAYAAVVKRIRAASPDAELVCLGVLGPTSARTRALDAEIAGACRDAAYVRMSSISSPAGIAERIVPRLRF